MNLFLDCTMISIQLLLFSQVLSRTNNLFLYEIVNIMIKILRSSILFSTKNLLYLETTDSIIDAFTDVVNQKIFVFDTFASLPSYSTMNFFGTSTVFHVCITYAFAILLGQSCIPLLCTIVPKMFLQWMYYLKLMLA